MKAKMMYQFFVTDSAFKRVAEILKKEKKASFLRVSVLGGGCSGFQYSFQIDQTLQEDDLIIDQGGIKVVIDSVSQPFIDGATLDFVDDLMGQAFRIENPNATAECGCGTSFAL